MNTRPSPNAVDRKDIDRYINLAESLGLHSVANTTKWQLLLDLMRNRSGWVPLYRFCCIDSELSGWDREWWYHVPIPFISVEWLELSTTEEVTRGAMVYSKEIDHSEWIINFLESAKFEFDRIGSNIRIFGYIPRNYTIKATKTANK